jgi:hypothetical protein
MLQLIYIISGYVFIFEELEAFDCCVCSQLIQQARKEQYSWHRSVNSKVGISYALDRRKHMDLSVFQVIRLLCQYRAEVIFGPSVIGTIALNLIRALI